MVSPNFLNYYHPPFPICVIWWSAQRINLKISRMASIFIVQAQKAGPSIVCSLVRNFGIWAFYHTSKVSFEGSRQRGPQSSPLSSSDKGTKCSSSLSSSVTKSHRHRSRPPSLGWGIMSRMAWSTRTTRKRRKRTMSQCTTLRAAAPCCQCSCQLPATPRLHNAPRECAIRMPRGKAANTGTRGPITPATGPGQASTRFCNLAEALLATGATFGNKPAKSVCSFCVLQLQSHPGAGDRRQGDRGQKIGDDCSSAVVIPHHSDSQPPFATPPSLLLTR